MDPTIYVITYHEFNHGKQRHGHPINQNFLQTPRNYVFYLIDKTVPEELAGQKVILEHDLDPVLHAAGGKHLGEWSFLLAEEKHAFCKYPFFMISSRFYEKNKWLNADLNFEWDRLFSFFNRYGWGYLPSYDRPLKWYDLSSWRRAIKNKAWKYSLFPFTEKTYKLIKEFYVDIPDEYRYVSDFFCNYIGFRSREDLLNYVKFYRPLIDAFFDDQFSLVRELSDYARPSGNYRNEKPFTFILELLSHLFFFKNGTKFFALHYNGYYEIDEARRRMKQLESFHLPFRLRVKRRLYALMERLNSNHSVECLKLKLKKNVLIYNAMRSAYRISIKFFRN